MYEIALMAVALCLITCPLWIPLIIISLPLLIPICVFLFISSSILILLTGFYYINGRNMNERYKKKRHYSKYSEYTGSDSFS